MQKTLPRPSTVNIEDMIENASKNSDPVRRLIQQEAAKLMANDAIKFPVPGAKVRGIPPSLELFDDENIAKARLAVVMEAKKASAHHGISDSEIQAVWNSARQFSRLPFLAGYESGDQIDQHQMLVEAFDVSN